VTERLGKDGKPELAIDFEKLQAELSNEIIAEGEERYQFTWPDKRASVRLANTPTTMTLRPCREESVDFDNTQNLYIEGDNLDVLKVLRETYLGKVKMIYIDPPYNTGNDFVYNDDFSIGSEEFGIRNGFFDEEGNQTTDPMQRNTESNGRFHTDWLNMIYPRLKVARDLLSDDGVIFISIDDNEVENLRKICDEVFGEQNFVTQYVWEKKKKPSFLNANIGTKTEYIVCYSKNRFVLGALSVDTTEEGKKYPLNNAGNSISILTFPPRSVMFNIKDGMVEKQDMSEGNIITELLNDLIIKNGLNENEFKLKGEWRYSQQRVNEIISNGETLIISKIPFRPNHIKKGGEIKKMHNLLSIAHYNIGTNEDATSEQISLLAKDYFDYAKPSSLIQLLIKAVSYNDRDSVIMDFFSGSATTAHAVMKLNAEDGGNRKFIMVQLPEKTDEKSEAYKAGYKNICEIGKERIRRAGRKINEELGVRNEKLDIGFRVLKLDSSNMEDVYYTPKEFGMSSLFNENVKSDRTNEDLLFQVMLDLGIELSVLIRNEELGIRNDITVFNVDDGYLMAVFDKDVDEKTITEIAKRKPVYFVMRDASASNDNVIDNFEQIFKHYSPETTCRVI
jgi:adenine-specific DNA-methyltransferase